MKATTIAGHKMVLHPSGALYWPENKTALLADVHLGKAGHFRKNGIAVPRKIEGVFYQKMQQLQNDLPIRRILFLGDLFHSDKNNEWFLFSAWVKQQQLELILIEGNHDIIPRQQFQALGITTVPHWEEEGLYFTHYPEERESLFVICGHVHPGIRLNGKGKQQLKLPCFFYSSKQFILPAFGAFTGLHLLQPTPTDRVFVLTSKEVLELPPKT